MARFQSHLQTHHLTRLRFTRTVLTDEDGSKAHLEIWKITAEGLVKQDPGPWLFR